MMSKFTPADVGAQKLILRLKVILVGVVCSVLCSANCLGQQSTASMTPEVGSLLYQSQQNPQDDSSRRIPPSAHVQPVNADRLVNRTDSRHQPHVQTTQRGPESAGANTLRSQGSPQRQGGSQPAGVSNGGQSHRSSTANVSYSPPVLEHAPHAIVRDAQVRPAVLDKEILDPKSHAGSRNEMSPVIDILDRINSRMNDSNGETTNQPLGGPSPDSRSSDWNAKPIVDAEISSERKTLDVSSLSKLATSELPVEGRSLQVGSANQSDFTKLIEKVCYSTLFVLVLGIGFVVVAKKFQGKGTTKPEKEAAYEFDVIGKIDLSPKASLTLVQIGDEKIVVASDSIGVKSVVHLNGKSANEPISSFSEAMEMADVPHDLEQTYNTLETKGSTYSLHEIGSAIKQSSATNGRGLDVESELMSASSKPRSRKSTKKTDAKIQAEMELALARTGLKDIVLKMIQAER